MKKFLLLLATFLSVAVIYSCKKDIETPKPEISLKQTSVEADAKGGDIIIEYTIENPIAGASVEIKCDQDWIADIFNNGEESKFIFNVKPNLEKENRTAQIIVSYPEAEDACLTLLQKGTDPSDVPFEIVIDKATNASITASVYPKDKEMTYLMMLTTKERYDNLGSDENNFQDDMNYYKEMADEAGMSLRDFLLENDILEKGDVTGYTIDNLEPGSEYYVYAYGLSENLERTTEIIKAQADTPEVEMTDNTFDFNYEMVNTVISGTIVPSDKSAFYFTSYVSKENMKNLYEIETIEEFAYNYIATEIGFNQLYYGMSLSDAVKYATITGDSEFEYTLEAETEYYLFAASVTEEGFVNSEIKSIEITSGKAAPSDNILEVSIARAGMVSVDMDITATNNDDYAVKVFPKSEIEGMDNDALTAHILKVRNFGMYKGNSKVIVGGLTPESDYYALAFGFDLNANAITTQIWKTEFRTVKGEDVKNVDFDFSFSDITPHSAIMNLTVNPDNAMYLWGVIDNTVDPAGIIDGINADCESYINYGLVKDRREYMLSKAHNGSIEGYIIKDLMEEGEYRVYAIGLSFETGEFVTDAILSEPFKTTATPLADIEIKVRHDKYFNGDELAAMYPEECGGALGYLILPLDVEISGGTPAEDFRFHIHTGNIMDKEAYSDGYVKDFLNDYGNNDRHNEYAMIGEKEYTIIAYAWDAEGNHSPVYRELIKLSYDGTSPAEEYEIPESTGKKFQSSSKTDIKKIFRVISNDNPIVYSESIATVNNVKTEKAKDIKKHSMDKKIKL